LTFPQAVALRYSVVETPERRLPQAVEDYALWFLARLRRLDAVIQDRQFLVADRFTVADIAVGFALHFGTILGLGGEYSPQVQAYLERLDPFKGLDLQLLSS
ncbi:MAG: glutathione S-transferase family protein, partial [Halopseudomonas sp.]